MECSRLFGLTDVFALLLAVDEVDSEFSTRSRLDLLLVLARLGEVTVGSIVPFVVGRYSSAAERLYLYWFRF